MIVIPKEGLLACQCKCPANPHSNLHPLQIIWHNSLCHTKRRIAWIRGALPADASFSMTVTKILNDAFLQHTLQPVSSCQASYNLGYSVTPHAKDGKVIHMKVNSNEIKVLVHS